MENYLPDYNAEPVRVERCDRTLHASEGNAMFACLRWQFPSIELKDLGQTQVDLAQRARANERGMQLFVPLSVEAVSLNAWLELRRELAPLLSKAQEEWRPVLRAHMFGVFSEAGNALCAEIVAKITAFDGGEGVLQPSNPREFLNARARWDPSKFRYEVEGLGTIGPEPDYQRLRNMAAALEALARAEGFSFTEDPHAELIVLAEHAFCEYCDPANYSSELVAQAENPAAR